MMGPRHTTANSPLLFLFFLLFIFLIFLSKLLHGQSPPMWKAPAFTDTIHNPYSSDTKVLEEAKKIYESMCWTCHGLKGKGNGPAAVALNPKPADHTSTKVQVEKDGNIYWKISTGKGKMQPYGKTLTSKQRWALVNYIRHLGAASESSIN